MKTLHSKVETSTLLPKWNAKISSANPLSSGSKENGWIWPAKQANTCSSKRRLIGSLRYWPLRTPYCLWWVRNTLYLMCAIFKLAPAYHLLTDSHVWDAHHQGQRKLRWELQVRGHVQGQVRQLFLWLGSERFGKATVLIKTPGTQYSMRQTCIFFLYYRSWTSCPEHWYSLSF